MENSHTSSVAEENFRQAERCFTLILDSFKTMWDEQFKLMFNYSNRFFQPYAAPYKNFWPFNGFSSNHKPVPLSKSFEEVNKIIESNTEYLEKYWPGIIREYKKVLESRLQLAQSLTELCAAAYNKQLDASRVAYTHLLEETNKQVYETAKLYQEFWLKLLGTFSPQEAQTGSNKQTAQNFPIRRSSSSRITEFTNT